MRLLMISAIATLAIDQLTKWFVVFQLDLITRQQIDVFPPFLRFRMGWNEGVNFGLFASGSPAARWILIGLAAVICVWVIWLARNDPDRRVQISAGVLIGGALGNVIDRALHGAVADFLNMSCCGLTNPYTFNVADIAIFLGAVGMVIWSGRDKTRDDPDALR